MVSMTTAISGISSTASAAQRRYPPINSNDPAKSFFDLIRAGKFHDTDEEYGASSVATKWPVLIEALNAPCTSNTFIGQTTADKYIEMLLMETGNPDRFEMAEQIALVMDEHNIATLYSDVVATICVIQMGENAEALMRALLRREGMQNFIQSLVTNYYGREPLYVLFSNLDTQMIKLQENASSPAAPKSSGDEFKKPSPF